MNYKHLLLVFKQSVSEKRVCGVLLDAVKKPCSEYSDDINGLIFDRLQNTRKINTQLYKCFTFSLESMFSSNCVISRIIS